MKAFTLALLLVSGAQAAPSPKKAAKASKPAKIKMRGRWVADKAVMTSFSQAVVDHVVLMQEEKGAFLVFDEKLQKHWSLALDKIHKDRIAKLSEDRFLGCADFDETDGTQKFDVDFFVTRLGDTYSVEKTVVHKIDGKPRFTYNDRNEQVSLREAARPPKPAKKAKARAKKRSAGKKLAPVKLSGGDEGGGRPDAAAAAAAAAAAGYAP